MIATFIRRNRYGHQTYFPDRHIKRVAMTAPVLQRYLDDQYLIKNPTWQAEDSPWKSGLVVNLMNRSRISPSRIADVGCGAGGVLEGLRFAFPDADLFVFDVGPSAARFWSRPQLSGINFQRVDFLTEISSSFDLILLLDVIEHVANPFDFLSRIRSRARHFVFHIPLDLSAFSVLRETPLIRQRCNVGHIHYFTKQLALVQESGFEVIDASYNGAFSCSPQRNWRTRLAQIPRRATRMLDVDWGVRLLGGETPLILARAAD